MNFEYFLAKKYIFAQKRHSLFTVCSIAVAVTVMAMLFTCYSVYTNIGRAAAYDEAPYHIRFISVDREKADLLEVMQGVKEVILTENPDGTFRADVMFKKKGINVTRNKYIHELARYLGIDEMYFDQQVEKGLVIYNSELMSYDSVDYDSRYGMLVIFCAYFCLILLVAASLRMVIDTAFEISSKERMKQFGVLQSIGAAPKQIVKIITLEGILLSVIGIPIGLILGVLTAFAAYKAILSSGVADAFLSAEKIESVVHFSVDPLMLLISALTGFVWIMLSAYGTGMRIIKVSPIEAINSRKNIIKKVKRFSLSGLFFGWEGKLASRNARREKKRFIITVISLMFSITLFSAGSSAIDSFRNYMMKVFGEFMTSDFEINPNNRNFRDPLEYKLIEEKLTDCGYFENIDINIIISAKTNDKSTKMLCFVNETGYDSLFGEEPSVSYADLEKSGGYILCASDKIPEKTDSVTWNVMTYTLKGSDVSGMSLIDAIIAKAIEREYKEQTLNITAVDKCKDFLNYGYFISDIEYAVAPISLYESGGYKILGDAFIPPRILCDLKNDSEYHEAAKFLENTVDTNSLQDNYIIMKQIRTIMTSISIALMFVTGLLILTALVNMMNIVSTGILNRRSEIAAMQCVGMTRGQLFFMIAAESLQYVLFAGISSVILCEAVLYGTDKIMHSLYADLDKYEYIDNNMKISYTEPLVKIGLSMLAAYAAAFISAFVPIRAGEKIPLAEQIRMTD